LIELVLVFPLQVNTTYGSDNPLESTEAKLHPSIKATVSNHPSPCAFIPWSLPNIGEFQEKVNIITDTWALMKQIGNKQLKYKSDKLMVTLLKATLSQ